MISATFTDWLADGTLWSRVGVIVVTLGLWYWTQSLLARRKPTSVDCGCGAIGDVIHDWSAPAHRWFGANPTAANTLLLLSSLVIDAMGIYILVTSVAGATFRPYLGLLMLFLLRQACQALCPLAPPPGMIWRSPGFPTLLVTYETSNDMFFSGHTALAVYGAACLAGMLGPWGLVLGAVVAVFEIGAVLVLRAHYTMDVFTGAVTALLVYHLAGKIAPTVDAWLG